MNLRDRIVFASLVIALSEIQVGPNGEKLARPE